jgi:Tfp pilus assembly protein PilF
VWIKKIFLKKDWIQCIIIIILVFSAYSNSLKNDFVYDDRENIVENFFIKSWSNLPILLQPKRYFSLAEEISYRPVTTFSYFVNYSIFKLNVIGWHLVNITLHSLNGSLIFYLVNAILKNTRIAFLTAILFVLHPIQTEAVNCISFREDLLCFLFFLLSFLFYIRYLKMEHYGLYFTSVTAYILALFSKEMAIALPLVLALYIFCFDRSKKLTSFYSLTGHLGVTVLFLIGRWSIFKPFGFVVGKDVTIAPQYPGGNLYSALCTTTKVIVYYMRLLCYPDRLSLCYDHFPISSSLFEPPVIISLFILLFVLIFAIKKLKDDSTKGISFAIFYFFITLLPVSNIIPFGAIMAERYLYIPSLGFCILVATVMDKLMDLKTQTLRFQHLTRIISVFLFCLLLIFYTTRIVNRNADWKNEETIWKATLKIFPNCARAHNGLGRYYMAKNDYNSAIVEFEEAVKISPNYVGAYYNLGNLYYKIGEFDKAIEMYRRALNIMPKYLRASIALGLAYAMKAMYDESERQFIKCLEMDPQNYIVYNNLGNVYFKKGLLPEAIEKYKIAIRLLPNYVDAHNNLGMVYFYKGAYREAANEFEKVLTLSPDNLLAREYYRKSIQYQYIREQKVK